MKELRTRLLWILLVFVLSMIVGFLLAEPVLEYIKATQHSRSIEWNVFSIGDAFHVYLKISFIIALTVTTPFSMYQVWKFIFPGLNRNEQRVALLYIPFVSFFFLTGILFSYFLVFPAVFQFMTSFSERIGASEVYGINQYFSFMFRLILPVGIVFELPLLVMFLTHLGVLTPKKLRKTRKKAYIILLILAAMITPPDIVSHLLVSTPLILLYEVSVVCSNVIFSRKQGNELKKT
ncbi:twin-arginine translocase subunit TatC [Alkalihalobacillus sp. TS-13]|uniref:twin-arginine translocase subunit TatC n=1 Tax=Alkalihalobacillus sp. TS-13 TaxID=2842455 RepID=UPI001C87E5E2|nr:twin-arginine translocase subunit TatC [Alkalihalobacillus sp. TS-13]